MTRTASPGRSTRSVAVLVIVGVLVVIAAVVLALGAVIGARDDKAPSSRAAPTDDIDGVRTFKGLGRTHVTTPVRYPQSPPVGGDHHPVWLNCGTYTAPVPDEHAVHSLEHGAVWITYDPALDESAVRRLRSLATAGSYVVVSPHRDVSGVTVTAWGRQLRVERASDPRVERFLQLYERAETAPEAGSPCTGGVGSPS